MNHLIIFGGIEADLFEVLQVKFELKCAALKNAIFSWKTSSLKMHIRKLDKRLEKRWNCFSNMFRANMFRADLPRSICCGLIYRVREVFSSWPCFHAFFSVLWVHIPWIARSHDGTSLLTPSGEFWRRLINCRLSTAGQACSWFFFKPGLQLIFFRLGVSNALNPGTGLVTLKKLNFNSVIFPGCKK